MGVMARIIDFPFVVIREPNDSKKKTETNHVLAFGIEDHLFSRWGYDMDEIDNATLAKMYYPFIESIVVDKVKNNTVKMFELIKWDSSVPIRKYPYNFNEIGEIQNRRITQIN